MVSPTVTQCLLESALRGAALVPRRALAVMGCEVLRVLQLSDTAIMPISYHVPRKVRGSWVRGWEGLRNLGLTSHVLVCHQTVEFHQDLFPDTAGCVPASDPHAWWAGSNQQVGPRPGGPLLASTSLWKPTGSSPIHWPTVRPCALSAVLCPPSLSLLPHLLASPHRCRGSASTQPAGPAPASLPAWCTLPSPPLRWPGLRRRLWVTWTPV